MSTLNAADETTLGALHPLQILIPPGVGHGYKVIGTGPGL